MTESDSSLVDLLTAWKSRGREKRIKAGVLLWSEGDPGSEALLILDGAAEIVQSSPDGREQLLRTVTAGEMLGEMACLDDLPHSSAVITKTTCRFSCLTSAELRELLSRHPHGYELLYHRQVDRVRNLTREMAGMNFNPILRRVAQQLIAESRLRGTMSIHMTHHDLARRVGATRESVTKALRALARQGIIRQSRGVIAIVSLERIEGHIL